MERECVLDVPVPALRDVNLKLTAGSRVVVCGPNGAGKSTLLRLLAGRHLADAGTVRCLGEDPSRSRALHQKVACVSTDGWGQKVASVKVSDILDGARNRTDRLEFWDDLVATLRLERLRRRETRGLSDGELRCLQLAVALASSPLLVLLDEACVELDIVVRADFLALLKRRAATILYATHVFDGLDDWPTHLMVVNSGRVERVEECAGTSASWLYRQALGDLVDVEPSHLPDDTGEVTVEAHSVTWAYDPCGPAALRAASLVVHRGSRVAVVGLNGSGKTTLLSLVAGARLDVSGSMLVLGSDPSAVNLRATGQVVLLGGAFKFALDQLSPASSSLTFSHLLASAIRHYADIHDPALIAARAARLVADLEIDHCWCPMTASSGQRTRMQLALQLAPPADLYVVDELTRDLDVQARYKLLSWLAMSPDNASATVLYATHILHGIETWATHIAHFVDGTIRTCLPTGALTQDVSFTVETWLRKDDAYRVDSIDVEPPAPVVGSNEQTADQQLPLPTGWSDRRENTIEGNFGLHSWSVQAAHGNFAHLHTTAHRSFASLYLSRGRGRSG